MLKGISRILMLGLFAVSVGCGGGVDDRPDMGTVTGTVTMDDKPLANASVTFKPDGSSRPSSGSTDANGEYELLYSISANGAKTGKHTVRISTRRSAGPGDDGEWAAGTPETVPQKYNSKTTLTADVKGGSNTIDFKLDSEGEVDVYEDEPEDGSDE